MISQYYQWFWYTSRWSLQLPSCSIPWPPLLNKHIFCHTSALTAINIPQTLSLPIMYPQNKHNLKTTFPIRTSVSPARFFYYQTPIGFFLSSQCISTTSTLWGSTIQLSEQYSTIPDIFILTLVFKKISSYPSLKFIFNPCVPALVSLHLTVQTTAEKQKFASTLAEGRLCSHGQRTKLQGSFIYCIASHIFLQSYKPQRQNT